MNHSQIAFDKIYEDIFYFFVGNSDPIRNKIFEDFINHCHEKKINLKKELEDIRIILRTSLNKNLEIGKFFVHFYEQFKTTKMTKLNYISKYTQTIECFATLVQSSLIHYQSVEVNSNTYIDKLKRHLVDENNMNEQFYYDEIIDNFKSKSQKEKIYAYIFFDLLFFLKRKNLLTEYNLDEYEYIKRLF